MSEVVAAIKAEADGPVKHTEEGGGCQPQLREL